MEASTFFALNNRQGAFQVACAKLQFVERQQCAEKGQQGTYRFRSLYTFLREDCAAALGEPDTEDVALAAAALNGRTKNSGVHGSRRTAAVGSLTSEFTHCCMARVLVLVKAVSSDVTEDKTQKVVVSCDYLFPWPTVAMVTCSSSTGTFSGAPSC